MKSKSYHRCCEKTTIPTFQCLATIFEPEYPRKFSVIAQGQDITQRLQAEKNLIHLSFHDHLTGLYNRRYFEEELSRLDTERNLPISIVMGDINGLKLINDSFGHAVGDELLIKMAQSMKRFFREDDIVARLGGDEFAILLPKTDTMEAENIIRRISDYSSKEKVMNIDLSVSFGFDTKKMKNEDLQTTLKNAEDAMYRLKLYENKSMRSKTIDVIMNALVEKSQRELMHSKRVSSICEKIAMEMHLKTEFVSQIRMAGLVHDIGKIGVDEKILNKASSLDNDEWEAIKKHPEAGWRILNSVSEFSEISEFVLSHHEKWDGTGYPRGLKGEQIPIEARIIMIADSYDAMTSMRSYRNALSEEEAANELRCYAGIQFDPGIAKVFVEKVLNKEWV
jgi:diguanylate cyclase (GGDEF)-like protein/putative nucleotidyltransferase with HDIG domain